MNTTAGTNTNPTANALAVIVLNVRTLVDGASIQTWDDAMTADEVDDKHQQIMGAIARIARINGNNIIEIDDLVRSLREEAVSDR